MAERKKAVKQRRREKKNVPVGHVHILASFNNTIITITDPVGAVVSWGSAGVAGFKGSRKSTPYAAALPADGAAPRALLHEEMRLRAPAQPAGPARRPAPQGRGLRAPAAREAEGPACLFGDGAAV